MGIAIVTGASSGIGREFVRQIVRDEKVDEIWAVARREDRLIALRQEISDVVIRPVALDLTSNNSIATLSALLRQENPEVRILVNAAGFGKFATYQDLSLEDTNAMIDLNCKAAVGVTLAVLPYMNKGARILEICSAAAFQPLPGLNIYAASKAFLYRFSRALRRELHGHGIKVCAVCPDWVRTEFFAVAKDTENGQTVRHFPFMAKPERVAARALRDSRRGFAVSTYSIAGLHRIAAKLIPHTLVMAVWDWFRKI